MTVKFSISVINGFLDSIESTVGTSPKLIFYTGTEPSLVTDASSGIMLARFDLPIDWMLAASAGQKLLNGIWSVSALADGIVGYYRIYETTETTCHEQGSVTRVGFGGDLILDNTNVTTGQVLQIVSKEFTSGNM